jgi:hypothetical protein
LFHNPIKKMKFKNILVCLFMLSYVSAFCQKKLNFELKNVLDSIYKKDQLIREFIDPNATELRKNEIEKEIGAKIENLNVAFHLMQEIDTSNIRKVEILLKKYGYAGKSIVGEPTNEVMWYVIQHSNKINKYYPIIAKAGRNKEIPKTLVVKMYDRILVGQKKEQIYGTQGKFILLRNKKTGIDDFFKYIEPIKDPDKVNKRRKKIGFLTTVEENAKDLGIIYKKYTYADLKKIFEENDIVN